LYRAALCYVGRETLADNGDTDLAISVSLRHPVEAGERGL